MKAVNISKAKLEKVWQMYDSRNVIFTASIPEIGEETYYCVWEHEVSVERTKFPSIMIFIDRYTVHTLPKRLWRALELAARLEGISGHMVKSAATFKDVKLMRLVIPILERAAHYDESIIPNGEIVGYMYDTHISDPNK